MASLIVSSPRYSGTEFAIPDQGVLTIGRDFNTNIPLESRMVSRIHAEVRSVGRGFVFTGLASSLRTSRNGRPRLAPTMVMEPQPNAPTPPVPAQSPGMRCYSCGTGIPFSDIASGAAGRVGANFLCEKCLRESNTISMIDVWNQ